MALPGLEANRLLLSASTANPAEQARILFDVDGYLLRYDRRLEGKVLGIAQDKLKCVFPWRQLDTCLCLSGPEMKVVLVLWNCFVRIEWLIHIDQ